MRVSVGIMCEHIQYSGSSEIFAHTHESCMTARGVLAGWGVGVGASRERRGEGRTVDGSTALPSCLAGGALARCLNEV